jgi:hypothetical protein
VHSMRVHSHEQVHCLFAPNVGVKGVRAILCYAVLCRPALRGTLCYTSGSWKPCILLNSAQLTRT